MGLGAGGRMEQAIYADVHGVSAWDTENAARCFVHLVSAEDFARITGEAAPSSPVDAAAYAKAGFPFFALEDQHLPAITGSEKLAGVKSVQALVPPEKPADDAPFEPKVKTLVEKVVGFVREGTW